MEHIGVSAIVALNYFSFKTPQVYLGNGIEVPHFLNVNPEAIERRNALHCSDLRLTLRVLRQNKAKSAKDKVYLERRNKKNW